MPLLEQRDGTHCCTSCGEDKPLEAFYRWRKGSTREAWYCDSCRQRREREWREHTGFTSTAAVRAYRSDPVKAERDRERSRRWKAENRERNRARDRAYRQRLKEVDRAA